MKDPTYMGTKTTASVLGLTCKELLAMSRLNREGCKACDADRPCCTHGPYRYRDEETKPQHFYLTEEVWRLADSPRWLRFVRSRLTDPDSMLRSFRLRMKGILDREKNDQN